MRNGVSPALPRCRSTLVMPRRRRPTSHSDTNVIGGLRLPASPGQAAAGRARPGQGGAGQTVGERSQWTEPTHRQLTTRGTRLTGIMMHPARAQPGPQSESRRIKKNEQIRAPAVSESRIQKRRINVAIWPFPLCMVAKPAAGRTRGYIM